MRPDARLLLLSIPLLCAPVAAGQSALATSIAEPEPRGLLTAFTTRSLLFDEQANGIWVLGQTYKIGFDRDGVTYVPFFGSDAPRNWPLRMSVAALRSGASALDFERSAVPTRAGDVVSYERGAFVERYELSREAVEQTFVLRERSGDGALEIELDLRSELELELGSGDLLFRSERGHVRYTGAVVIDARGERVPAATSASGGRIRIELPASDHARLRYPLVVDPVISTFAIVPHQVPSGQAPDVAHDAEGGDFALVFEFPYSATDTDLLFMLRDEQGAWLWEGIVDASTYDCRQPCVARNEATGHLVACTYGVTADVSVIAGRFLEDGAFQFEDWEPLGGNGVSVSHFPDVGGDRSHDAARDFCVVWQHELASGDTVVEYRMVGSDGVAAGAPLTLAANPGTQEVAPSIATWSTGSSSAPGTWTVAWQRFRLLDSDLYSARIRADGTLEDGPGALDTSGVDTRLPSVSSETTGAAPRTLVAYTRGSSANARSWGYVMDGVAVRQHVNLSALTGAPADRRQIYPCAEAIRDSFVFVECEQIPSTSYYGVHLSTLAVVDDRLHVGESRQSVGASAQVVGPTSLAVPYDSGVALAAWTWEGFGPEPTLFASLYRPSDFTSFCEPGAQGVLPCPCGNAPGGPGRGCDNASQTGGASLTGSGTAVPDAMSLMAAGMRPSSVCLLVQGNQVGADAAFGDGVRCVYGTVLRMGVRTASAGAASWPAPGGPSLQMLSAQQGDPIAPGSSRYYFVYYRDAQPGWACDAVFNSSNALRVNY